MMTPEQKRSVVAKLKAAGVCTNAIKTSLLVLSQPDLRKFVTDKAWKKPPFKGVFLYPITTPSTLGAMWVKCELVLDVVAKEMIREGGSVHVTTLGALLRALRDSYDNDLLDTLETVDIVFLSSFFSDDAGTTPFRDGQDKHNFDEWLTDRLKKGKGVSYCSSSPLVKCKAWWPDKTLQAIADNTETFTVR